MGFVVPQCNYLVGACYYCKTTTNRLAMRNVGLHNAYKLHVYSIWCSCPSSPDGTLERKTELTNDIEQNRGNFLMLCKSAHFVWYVVAAVSSISNESIKYSWHPGI